MAKLFSRTVKPFSRTAERLSRVAKVFIRVAGGFLRVLPPASRPALARRIHRERSAPWPGFRRRAAGLGQEKVGSGGKTCYSPRH